MILLILGIVPMALVCGHPDRCSLPQDSGHCRGSFQRYYYDKKSHTCKTFIYGGCDGNQNNFETEKECQRACFMPSIPICSMDKERGNGFSSVERFYFNKHTKKCEKFIFTGLGGNRNNFVYKFECERYCPGDLDLGDICKQNPEAGNPGTNVTCLAYIPRYYFNKKSGKCEKFIFGGCGGNHNNFATVEECEKFCKKDVTPREACKMKPDTGPCAAVITRFYYDAKTGTCKTFSYGGCCGNENNFKSRQECLNTCYGKSCLAKPETGPCKAAMSRYYYDPVTGTCKRFTYGGCGGNGNRYETIKECFDKCSGIWFNRNCLWDKDEGTGNRCYRRYYFDRVLEKCLPFTYSGRGGNQNNFRTMRECQFTCLFNF